MELLVLGAYLQDGQAWTVAWKCLIPNNYSFLNISLSPTGNFWWFHCVSLWNLKPSWLQKIRKQLHSKPDFSFIVRLFGDNCTIICCQKASKVWIPDLSLFSSFTNLESVVSFLDILFCKFTFEIWNTGTLHKTNWGGDQRNVWCKFEAVSISPH